MKYEVSCATAARIAPFSGRTDVHWVTTSLQLWNALEVTAEQLDLVYEVSWSERSEMFRA